MASTVAGIKASSPAKGDRGTAPGSASVSRMVDLQWCYRASLFIGVLLAVASGFGLFLDGIYKNNTYATAAFRGTDLVSLAVAVPVLFLSIVLARRGSRRAQMVWLGALAYVAYTYLYTFAIAWNRLFLVYLVLLSLSAFTIVRALTAVDAREVAGRFSERTPVRSVGTFLWVIGGMLGVVELAQVVPALISGAIPELVRKTGNPTGIVYILDLGLVVPLFLLAGRWMRRRRPWGYVAAAILLVKGVTEGLALLSSSIFISASDLGGDGPLMGLWAAIALGSLWMLVRFLRSMDQEGGSLR